MEYSPENYKILMETFARAETGANTRPDAFQYLQNELSKTIARFLLAPYLEQLNKDKQNEAAAPVVDAPPAAE